MTITRPTAARIHIRMAFIIGMIITVLVTGTGTTTARWIIEATASTPVTAGQLTTELAGTAQLGGTDLKPGQYTRPVALALRTSSPVPVDYTLQFETQSGTLNPADIELAVWRPTGATCPDTAPSTGMTTGTLVTPPQLPSNEGTGWSSTVVCAATRLTGSPANSGGLSLTTTPTLTADLTTGTWTAKAVGAAFTHTAALADILNPGPITNLTCTNVDDKYKNSGIELAWDPVDGAIRYEIRTDTGRVINPDATNPSGLLHIDDVDSPYLIEVVAVGADGTSTPAYQNVHTATGDGMGKHLRCGPNP